MRLGNPGLGAYGIVLIAGQHQRELSGGYRRSDQVRLALTALALALESLKIPAEIRATTASLQVAEMPAKGQAARWREHRWQNRGTERIENADLWERVLKAADPHWMTALGEHAELSAGRRDLSNAHQKSARGLTAWAVLDPQNGCWAATISRVSAAGRLTIQPSLGVLGVGLPDIGIPHIRPGGVVLQSHAWGGGRSCRASGAAFSYTRPVA